MVIPAQHPILKKRKFHAGIDWDARLNQSVYATADGEVIEVGYHSGVGNFIRIKHSLGFETIYGHLSSINIAIKDKIFQGQTIGFCGSTGMATGVHLHYEVLRFKQFVNPLGMLAKYN
jgi:murein DD-endopeptidase MepM/ murein hydrolase activator NlpD